MYGCADGATGLGNQLPPENSLTNPDNRLCRIASMLCDREYELRGNRDAVYRLCRRCSLVGIEAQATVQLAQIVGRCAHVTLCMLMQSTGQGARHNSQPVHSASIIVCIM